MAGPMIPLSSKGGEDDELAALVLGPGKRDVSHIASDDAESPAGQVMRPSARGGLRHNTSRELTPEELRLVDRPSAHGIF